MDGHRTVSAGQPRRLSTGKSYFLGGIAVAALVGILGTSPTEAATSIFWPDYYEPTPQPRFVPPRVRKSPRHHRLPKDEVVAKDARKPQGPVIIAVSIERQVLKIYDANGYFAETPISTGMKGHSTPMGVFSILEKHKYHQSNIYSGAPMPYMQRITWSGVAMHAGVLPGYPASHGCIRMPMSFAMKLWNWTRMGARVVVTPGELTPENFSHPLLVTQKVVPTPVADAQPEKDVVVAAKSDKAASADAASKAASSEASLELKSTVGHEASTLLRDQTHTADASGALSAAGSPVTVFDATSSANGPAAKADRDATNDDAKSAMAEAAPKSDGTMTSDAARSDAPGAIGKPEEQIKPADAVAAIPDVKKDQARPSDPEQIAVPKPAPVAAEAPKRSGQIAVLISRKDGKLYVRQNFKPLFDAPVAIAPGDRPLGTHIFTARTDRDDANLLHWSVVSMPVVARNATRQDEDERGSRRRKTMGAIEVKATPVPDSAAEALDRLTIPADAMARITEALSTGGSIIVSDQGVTAGETGLGTDFIIPLR